MLRSNSKSLGNHVVIPEEEKERLRYGKVLQKREVLHTLYVSSVYATDNGLRG